MSYQSYEYLKTKNVFPCKLSKVVGRIEEHDVELGEADEKRAMGLHQESIVIDFHNHLRVLPEDPQNYEIYARSGRVAIGYEGVKRSGMTACFSGLGGTIQRRSSPKPWQFEDLVWDLGMKQADMSHHQDLVIVGRSVQDILEAKNTGKTAVFAMTENVGGIGNDIDKLDVLYGLGIRCMGLSYNMRTSIADGLSERADSGLSDFGLKVIERMNRLGVLIDFSHSSDLTIKEGVQVSEAPCCLSHSLARQVNNNQKGKTDEILETVAKHGGVIGVEAVPNITSDKEVQTVWDVMDHVDYIVKLVGVDHVAIGTDSLFGDHVGGHKSHRDVSDLKGILKAFPATHIEYLENPGQWPNVTRALVARGYSDEDIKKIIGGNILRILERTIG